MLDKVKSFLKKQSRSSLAGISLVMLAVALKGFNFYTQYLTREFYLNTDNAIYALLAERFLEGDFTRAFHPYWNAGFAIASIPFYLWLGNWEGAQIIISIVSVLSLSVILYFILRKYSEAIAVLTSMLFIFLGTVDSFTMVWGITEPFYLLLFWPAVYFSWKSLNSEELRNCIFTGVFIGLVYFTRTEAIYLLAALLLLLAAKHLTLRRKAASLPLTFKKGRLAFPNKLSLTLVSTGSILFFYFSGAREYLFLTVFFVPAFYFTWYKFTDNLIGSAKTFFSKIAIIASVFVLINLPYFSVVSINLGKPTMTGKYAYFNSGPPFKLEPRQYTSYAQDVWSIDFPNYNSKFYESDAATKAIWSGLDTNLESFVKKFKENMNRYWSGNYLNNFEAALVVVGIVSILFLPVVRTFGLYLVAIWILGHSYVSFFMEMTPRYLTFTLPILCFFMAVGVYSLGKAFKYLTTRIFRKKPQVSDMAYYAFLAVFFLFYLSRNVVIGEFFNPKKIEHNQDQKQIGDWLRSNNVDVFMGRTEGIGFYADADLVYVPAAPPDVIVEYAKAWGVEYIVSRPAESSWEYMREIVNPDYQHPDVDLMHSFEDGTLIWKVSLTEEEKRENLRTGHRKFRGPEVY